MKKYWLIALTCLATIVAHADPVTIVLWDFDYPEVPIGTFGSGDANPGTGTFSPAVGSGVLTNVGTTTNIFLTPANGGASATSDNDVSDNSALRLGLFPAQSTANKTAGIQIFTSTAGYENIKLTFDQENSASASLYWRVQYSLNSGTNWTDFTLYTAAVGVPWVNARTIDFSAVSGARDNTNFGIRIVSEWQSTATGSGAASYVGQSAGTTTAYSTAGTLWLDMVTVSGTVIVASSNTSPTITSILDQTVGANKSIASIPFTVNDAETPANQLTVQATSANGSLIQNTDIQITGTGTNRTLSITPEQNQFGSSQITVIVTDGGNLSASSLFNVTVVAPGVITTNQSVRINNNASGTVQITGLDSFLGTVTLSADSTNTTLLPDSNIGFSGSGTNRTITLTPVTGQMGVTFVTVTVTDGSLTATNSFYLDVLPTNTIVYWDFNSPIVDFNANTGTTAAAVGIGTITNCGSATNSIGTITVTNSDQETLDNSKLRLSSFPTQGTSNKTSGLEIHASTLGYQNIALSFDQYESATASRFFRVQYTLDGSTYVDFTGYSNNVVTTTFNTNFSFGAVAGANNNSNFAVRIVAEYESTAIGTSVNNYDSVQDGGTYSPVGTLWFDSVKLTGDPYVAGANTPPSITQIGDQSISANATVTLPFTVGDAQTAAAQLTVTAQSGNLGLISASDISLGGSGANRNVTIHPEANQLGTGLITLTVNDGNGGTNSVSFNVTVQAPAYTLTNQTLVVNTPATVQLDVSSFLGTVNISVDSSNTAVISDPNISISGSGSTRTITFTPVQDQVGATLIRLGVTDGTFTTSNAFYIHYVPTNTITLWDFNSAVYDQNANTGNILPAFGSGTAQSAGPATNSLISNVAAIDLDPEQADNSKWRFGAFPAQNSGNKTGGAEFHVSTVGRQNIKLAYEHYNSASASEYWRVQYSLDGTTYTDLLGYGNTLVTTWFPTNVDFSSITGANNNPKFAVRIVSEFISTATGAGNNAYAAVNGGAYSSAGTLWLDDVDFTGDAIVTVVQPSLSVSASVGGSLSISWPTSATGAVLQSTPTLNPANWQNVSQMPTVQGGQNVVTISTSSGNQFFRLVH